MQKTPQWLRWRTVVVVFSMLTYILFPVHAQTCSANRGYPGVPGIPGNHGTNGRNGPRGQAGDPGEASTDLKGSTGEAGARGPPGRSGQKGDPGETGPRGPAGPRGEMGTISASSNVPKSFFSFQRSSSTATHGATVIFDRSSLSQHGDPLPNGEFTCPIKGVYFFVYHVSAKAGEVCLSINKGLQPQVSFCDRSSHLAFLTSGSVLLELDRNDKVSVHSVQGSMVLGRPGRTDSTFTGFLLFPTS